MLVEEVAVMINVAMAPAARFDSMREQPTAFGGEIKSSLPVALEFVVEVHAKWADYVQAPSQS
jgi:hypothetical protein